ncbi:MAG: ribosomal-protein-alanine acetyltransferase [Holophagaceae bacterium]|nr:ribosomal-protein-alanine acetyltransferase [Holophagaceae bacterium]
MTRILPLGPGSELPAWVENLEKVCFHQAWGPMSEHELLWVSGEQGFARWSAYPSLGEAELLRIAVDSTSRREGIGRALLRASVRGLRELGIQEAHLEVRVSNAGARTLYEGEGWQFQGLRRSYYRDGEDAALYLLKL